MSIDCSRCGWSSDDDEGDPMPFYNVTNDGIQVTHCPDCMKILDTCENNTRAALDARNGGSL